MVSYSGRHISQTPPPNTSTPPPPPPPPLGLTLCVCARQPVNYANHLKLAEVLYSLDEVVLARKYYAQSLELNRSVSVSVSVSVCVSVSVSVNVCVYFCMHMFSTPLLSLRTDKLTTTHILDMIA